MKRLATVAMLAISYASLASAKKSPLSQADEGRNTMRVYSGCIVRTSHAGLAHTRLINFLSRSADAPDSHSAAAALSKPDCLQEAATPSTYVSQLRFQPALLRGSALRALYLEHLAHSDRVALQPSELTAGWINSSDGVGRALRDFGDCVVGIDRTNADAVIRSNVASDAESNAYHLLRPAFSRCILADTTLHFSRMVIEGVLAEALYRQATGAVPAATTTEAK